LCKNAAWKEEGTQLTSGQQAGLEKKTEAKSPMSVTWSFKEKEKGRI